MVRVASPDDLPGALRQLEVNQPRAVLVVVGSAQRLAGARLHAAEQLLEAVVVPLCEELGVDVVDGGTDAGVMQAIGQARAAAGAEFALVGVVAGGTVAGSAPDVAVDDDPVQFEPNHTHFVIVPGSDWGDESPWITRVASELAGSSPVAGLLVGGGDISVRDVGHLVEAGYPVFALGGSGNLADTLGAGGPADDADVEKLRASALVQPVAGFAHPDRLAAVLRAALRASDA
jgi:SLOG in TRPM, prokaryote